MRFTMSSYLAFKAIKVVPRGQSPAHGLAWKRQEDGLVVAKAPDGLGIHAATYRIASKDLYPHCRLFLVAPYIDTTHPDDATVELYEEGWRANAAVIVAPFINFAQAADLILAAHRADYPQLKAILDWAKAFAQRPPWTAAKARRILAQLTPHLGIVKVGGKWLTYDKRVGPAHSGRACGTSPKDVLATVLEYHEGVALGVTKEMVR